MGSLPERAAALPGPVEVAADARAAVAGADVVITAASIVERPEPPLAHDWLANDYLLPLDFDANVQRAAIEQTDLFVVDDVAQFDYYRDAGHFRGWPVPHASLGEAIGVAGHPRRAACVNLGIGALDAAFAAAVVRRARGADVGQTLSL